MRYYAAIGSGNRRPDIKLPEDYEYYDLFNRWHKLTGASYTETMNTSHKMILRFLDYNDIETKIMEKNRNNGSK